MIDRNKLLARQARYNASRKGKERYRRYEAKHPERRTKWSPLMIAKAHDRVNV